MSDFKVLNNGDTYRNIRTNINENFETLENKIVRQGEQRPPVVYLPYEVYIGFENKDPWTMYICSDVGYIFFNNKMYGYTELVTVDALVRNGVTFPCTTAEFIEKCNSIGVDCYVYMIRADITDLPADHGILSCKLSLSGGPVCLEFIEDNSSERYIYINGVWRSIVVINDDSESVKSTWSSDKISKKIDSRIAEKLKYEDISYACVFKTDAIGSNGNLPKVYKNYNSIVIEWNNAAIDKVSRESNYGHIKIPKNSNYDYIIQEGNINIVNSGATKGIARLYATSIYDDYLYVSITGDMYAGELETGVDTAIGITTFYFIENNIQ